MEYDGSLVYVIDSESYWDKEKQQPRSRRKRCILIGDGVKQSKEAFHMAGVKKLLQESENSSKLQYIFGHMFGAAGMLIGRKGGKFCVPLQMNIQDGLRAVSSWDGSGISPDSHVVQMVRNALSSYMLIVSRSRSSSASSSNRSAVSPTISGQRQCRN